MTSRHWASSPPFKYLRRWFGITKPRAAQWGEWDDWNIDTARDHPVGYWMTEKLPSILEKIPETFIDPFHNISYYIRNRWHRQTHVLPTRFKPGRYSDLRERLLYGMMESLVDFVEVEKAWMQYICDDTDTVELGKRGRSAEAGLAHLQWETTLDDPALTENERSDAQAVAAREIIELYNWWKDVRPHRPDPYDVSGWSKYCDERTSDEHIFDERIPRTEEEDARISKMLKSAHELETAYDAEDERMLIRLVKIRLSLWT